MNLQPIMVALAIALPQLIRDTVGQARPPGIPRWREPTYLTGAAYRLVPATPTQGPGAPRAGGCGQARTITA